MRKRIFLTCMAAIGFVICFSQDRHRPGQKRIMVKTNVLNLFARRPIVSVEKAFTSSFSTEVSFVQGEFNNILFTDHYDYHGILVRLKKYISPLTSGQVNPYLGMYIGNLIRNLESEGRTDNSGFFSYPGKHLKANSIRLGGTLGVAFFSKSNIVIDGQASLGFGKYFKYYSRDPNHYYSGYLDTQIWLSVGYCF